MTSRLGYSYPESVVGIHLTSITRPTPYLGPGSRELTKAEQEHADQRERWQQSEGGYAHIQGNQTPDTFLRPQRFASRTGGLDCGKYRTWSDCGGNVESKFTKDELLTIVTIYWVTQTISSSTRMYYENQSKVWMMGRDELIQVPSGMALFPQEIARPPREWAKRSYNVCRWTEMPSGGHFAALEEPELLAEDIRAFFRPLRSN